jgi:hypothetical protein
VRLRSGPIRPPRRHLRERPRPLRRKWASSRWKRTTHTVEPLIGDLDVLGRFYADLARTPLLDREAERSLTKEISRARESVVRWLRRNRGS